MIEEWSVCEECEVCEVCVRGVCGESNCRKLR